MESNLSFRLLLLFALTWKATIFHLNVRNAFLYGALPEPTYLQLSAGHPDANLHNKVWTTTRSLYGLCQAPRHWNHSIEHFLLSFGFYNLQTAPCLFAYNEGGKRQKNSDDKSEILNIFKSNLRIQQKNTLASPSYRKRIRYLSTNIDTSTKRWNDSGLQKPGKFLLRFM